VKASFDKIKSALTFEEFERLCNSRKTLTPAQLKRILLAEASLIRVVGGAGDVPNVDGAKTGGTGYLYHDPCHTPMKTHTPIKVASRLMGQEALLSDRCCGEAGTLGTSRPDIANQLRYRKQEELTKGIHDLTGRDRADGDVKLLTSCPACQQGLAKFADDTGLKTDYIVVELANRLLGEGWQQRFLNKARDGGIERVLL